MVLERSFPDTICGAVDAIDGFFQRCNKPSLKEVGHVNLCPNCSQHRSTFGLVDDCFQIAPTIKEPMGMTNLPTVLDDILSSIVSLFPLTLGQKLLNGKRGIP